MPESMHEPSPLHRSAELNVEPEQVAATQIVVGTRSLHAPRPSQLPSCRQEATGWATHSFLGSVARVAYLHEPAPLHTRHRPHSAEGSVLLAMLVHVPTKPVRPHETHSPVQAAVQQTPSAQKFELHSSAAPHAVPSAFLGTHTLEALH